MRTAARIGLVAAAAVLLVEVGVRVLPIGPAVYAARTVEPEGFSPFRTSREGLLVYAPRVRWTNRYDPAGDPDGRLGPDGRVEYATNALGLRGPERSLEKPEGVRRVLCLGDSFTFGEGVRYEDTYAAQLERLLGEGTEVWNAGVQAYDTVQASELLITRLLRAAPDVVVLGFFLNDATPFETTIAQFEARTARFTPTGLGRASKAVELWQRASARARAHAEYVETTRAAFRGPGWERCERALEALKHISRAESFRLVVLVFPVLHGLESPGAYPFEAEHERIAAALERLEIDNADLLESLRGRSAADLWAHPTDPHPNAEVHAVAARELARLLAR